MDYWHFTCDHARAQIGREGMLKPHFGYVWLTDLPHPPREAVGLTSQILKCDRLEHRYRVLDVANVRPWLFVRRLEAPSLVESLETAPGAMPRHWYVSTEPVPVVLDP